MKILAAIFSITSSLSVAHADGMSNLWDGLSPAALQAAAQVQAGWSNTKSQYFACTPNGDPDQCPQNYICCGTNQCLPHFCYMGCAYNSPCRSDGTCNYGE